MGPWWNHTETRTKQGSEGVNLGTAGEKSGRTTAGWVGGTMWVDIAVKVLIVS